MQIYIIAALCGTIAALFRHIWKRKDWIRRRDAKLDTFYFQQRNIIRRHIANEKIKDDQISKQYEEILSLRAFVEQVRKEVREDRANGGPGKIQSEAPVRAGD